MYLSVPAWRQPSLTCPVPNHRSVRAVPEAMQLAGRCRGHRSLSSGIRVEQRVGWKEDQAHDQLPMNDAVDPRQCTRRNARKRLPPQQQCRTHLTRACHGHDTGAMRTQDVAHLAKRPSERFNALQGMDIM